MLAVEAKWERPVLGVPFRDEVEEGSVEGVSVCELFCAGENWNWFDWLDLPVKLLDSPERSCSGD